MNDVIYIGLLISLASVPQWTTGLPVPHERQKPMCAA